MRSKLTILTVALLLAAGVAACGEDDESPGTSAAATPEATETPEPQEGNVGEIVAGITKKTGRKPEVATPQGDPPTELVSEDIVTGKGRAAKPGDVLTMQYVGVSWSTGEQFDASWDRGQPFQFQLGAQMVIPGWDQGMVGMKEGGRRLLIIPPEMGYGPQGQGPIAPNETLIFAVDLEKLGQAG